MGALHYWYARCEDDNDCYSAIGTTKKAVEKYIDENGGPKSFGLIEKRVIYYKDLWDLFEKVTSEGGGRGAGEVWK